MIPAEAVEAGREAILRSLERMGAASEIGWGDVARAALEAAAPHMFAQALEDAVHAFPLETIVAPDNAVVWMMRRAEELRSKR